MAECKSTQKSGPVTEGGLGSISKILNLLLGVFNMMQKPAQTIPPFLLLAGAELRPGMSARDLAANVISRMESEAGIPMGDIFADGPNKTAAAMLVQCQEMVSHIQQNAKVTTVIPPGSILFQGTGANAGGPFVTNGSNILPAITDGVIQ
jgi:hypothetical protein